MRKVIQFACFVLLLIFLIGWGIPDQYSESYERPIVRQYDYFRGLGGGKIILIGGSSLSFGMDLDLLEELTGRPCVILGNHGGYGVTYHVEMSKSNLHSGDIVVLEFVNTQIDSCDLQLLLIGMGKRYDMYRFLHPAVWDRLPEAYASFLKMSFDYWLHGGYHAAGVYSSEAYDSRGNMIYPREKCTIPEPFTEEAAEYYHYAEFRKFKMEPEFRKYLNEYIRYCSEKNVKVYITHGPRLDEAVTTTLEDADAYDQSIREQIDAPLISKMQDYIFPREYIYDVIGHCNEKGAKYRTRLLYEDLLPYLL